MHAVGERCAGNAAIPLWSFPVLTATVIMRSVSPFHWGLRRCTVVDKCDGTYIEVGIRRDWKDYHWR